MGSLNLQNKIKIGLAKAINATGSITSDLVFIVKRTQTGGGNTPSNPPVFSDTNVLLVDAVFKTYDSKLVDANYVAGDRVLVSNSDVDILEGETIIQGDLKYVVIDVDIKGPTSDILAYESQVRLK